MPQSANFAFSSYHSRNPNFENFNFAFTAGVGGNRFTINSGGLGYNKWNNGGRHFSEGSNKWNHLTGGRFTRTRGRGFNQGWMIGSSRLGVSYSGHGYDPGVPNSVGQSTFGPSYLGNMDLLIPGSTNGSCNNLGYTVESRRFTGLDLSIGATSGP
ncbi:hypothetical protein L1987_02418 [Smallanthus sonchifolius]|uniref:Uncharacterized protein n=1 Tax=Smallanthus sonchifolius TaxID=185202 RepID=A0ACB9K7T2_9ASTR|nr:hypothetical protein L1987_02418 [Smallanthus sonchifolius]